MSVSITVEIEDGFSRLELFSILSGLNFNWTPGGPTDDGGVIGFFCDSGILVSYRDRGMERWGGVAGDIPLSGDCRVRSWLIGMRVSMKYRYSLADECDSDIKAFLCELNRRCRSRFVAAYDYEVLYALKDVHGFQWFE